MEGLDLTTLNLELAEAYLIDCEKNIATSIKALDKLADNVKELKGYFGYHGQEEDK